MSRIDLHTHTTASDGIMHPHELVDHAIEKDVRVLAIADHDTVDGLQEAIDHAAGKDISLVPAIEFSIDWKRGTFHIVALHIDYYNQRLRSALAGLSERRSNRAERIVEDLARHGVHISMDEVMDMAAGGVIGKPHIARVLVKRGHAPDIKSVFTKFLEKGLPGYVPKDKVSFSEAMELIHGAGGIPILAHPASLEYNDFGEFRSMLSGFMDGGLAGIEVYADMHSPEEVATFLAIAGENNLLVSGGSDFHGDKNEEIGFYDTETPIPINLYDSIREYHEKNLS